MSKTVNIGIVGTQFMGRAHSNAWINVDKFYNLPLRPVMKAACDNVAENLEPFCQRFGWQSRETDWKKLVARDDIDVIDICTSNNMHMPIAVAAAKTGKHVFCEKPVAMNADEARAILDAAKTAGVKHMVAFNYRRVPAIALAKQMVEEGKIGRVFHFSAVYYQDWLVDPAFPYVWRHDKQAAGSGAHGDMNAHTVDLARFLVGEIEAVCAADEVFIKERKLADGSGMGKVTADDALFSLARFSDGALGSFMATRFASGRKNFLRFELFGSEGSLLFNLERLNEIQYYTRSEAGREQGFRTILATESDHPYINKWWPPGHIIGWEHTFIHEVGDLLTAIGTDQPITPDFYDGLRNQQVLDAMQDAAAQKAWVSVPNESRTQA
ncbi:MAG: Gfo/Idh/MocA family protein [Planctomycetota bacterium]